MNPFKNIYLNRRFFLLLGVIILCFCFSFIIEKMFVISILLCFILFGFVILDLFGLFAKNELMRALRKTSKLLSLNDDNIIEIEIQNLSQTKWYIDIIDELPEQLQIRNFKIKTAIHGQENISNFYNIKPKVRGEYHFGAINIMVMSYLQLVKRRIRINANQMVPVYPSIIQMKKLELYTFSQISKAYGIKKMRRIGLSYEFEQIKNYVRGDDIRQINWKSSARNQQLMVNQFEDEKSQPIYNIIDKSRVMLMPFNGLSLMDYAINASLVISNVALKKQDKIGLITYSDMIGSAIRADRKHGQLNAILQTLYNQNERDFEANYEHLYYGITRIIKTRSLIFLYSNFESMYSLIRVLPILRNINKLHLLVVIFFQNEAIKNLSEMDATDLKEVYTQILAEQALNEKIAIANELNNIGIQTILTKPEDLNINTLNKYLEIKSRGLI
ncbi:MAG: DUF58 domain-containing protein [Bacteroidota bacterium]|nr:DUF58 domain-containing protein [Bacteroidota bacterium]